MTKKMFTDMLTGADNTTFDIGRLSWMVSILVILIAAIWEVVHTNSLPFRDIAESLGIVSGAHGASIWAKKDAEPQ
jgi:hypothetical protein